jgi:hypothetical protein
MPLHDRVVAALHGSARLSPVSKAAYEARLKRLPILTGHGLKRVLLEPEQSLHALKRHRCDGSGRHSDGTQHNEGHGSCFCFFNLVGVITQGLMPSIRQRRGSLGSAGKQLQPKGAHQLHCSVHG